MRWDLRYFSQKREYDKGMCSCSLFTFYINNTIKAIRQYGDDHYLGNMHSLLVMDDTLSLVTSREAMEKKLEPMTSRESSQLSTGKYAN